MINKSFNKIKRIYKKIKKDKHLFEIIEGGSTSFILKIFGITIGFLFTIFVTRNFGAQSFGLFSLCLTILSVIIIFTKFGMDRALMRYTSMDKAINRGQNIEAIFKKMLNFLVPISIFVTIIIFAFSNFISIKIFNSKSLSVWLKVTSLGILPLTLVSVLTKGLRGLKEIKWSVFLNSISRKLFALLILSILFLFLNNAIITISAYIVGVFLSFFLAFYLWKEKVKFFSIPTKINSSNQLFLKNILSKSFPMLLAGSMSLVISSSDKIILGIFEPEASLGIYSTTLQIATNSIIVLLAFNKILSPKISEAYSKRNFQELNNIIQKGTKLVCWATFPILILLFSFSSQILRLFGREFVNGEYALYILLIGFIVNILAGPVGQILQMTNNEKSFQNIMIFSAGINILLNLVLIPILGIIGAAVATTISHIIWNVISVYKIKKELDIYSFFNPFSTYESKI